MGASTKKRPRPAGLPLGPPSSLPRPTLSLPAAHSGLGRCPTLFPVMFLSFIASLVCRGRNGNDGRAGGGDSSDTFDRGYSSPSGGGSDGGRDDGPRSDDIGPDRRGNGGSMVAVLLVVVLAISVGPVTLAILSCSKKVHRSRQFRVVGRKSAGGTKPNGPQGGLWVC